MSPELAPPSGAAARAYQWWDARLTRAGVTGWFRRDTLLGLVVAAATVLSLALLLLFAADEAGLGRSVAQSGWVLTVAAVQGLALCLRRVRPLWCLAVVVACQVGVIATVPEVNLRGVAPFIVAYTIGSRYGARWTVAAMATVVAVEGAAGVTSAAYHSADAVVAGVNHLGSSALTYTVSAFVGAYVAARRRYAQLAQERVREAARAQQVRVRAAIAGERAQIARELHDIAAHHLSSMVVQAAAVERLVDRDPPAAKAGAEWLRRQSKETLDNVRLVVGLLRDPDRRLGSRGAIADAGEAQAPGLAALDELVRTARELGTEVEFVRAGAERELSPLAAITLYRVAQQALTNARQHAPGAPVRIALTFQEREVWLEVVNAAPGRAAVAAAASGGGAGLIGMRERAELVGGKLTAGPTDDGGWRVRLRLPVSGADVPEPVVTGDPEQSTT